MMQSPFARHFYHYEPSQTAAEIAQDIRRIAQELEGSLEAIFRA